MTFINSIKLFCSNWDKVLKLFLYYLFVLCVTILLLLPVFFAFSEIIKTDIQASALSANYLTMFHASFGVYLHDIMSLVLEIVQDAFAANVGLVIYAAIVVCLFLPFLFNIGKYVVCEMLYGYMANKSKVGFFSALFKTLNRSVLYALFKTLYDIIFMAIILISVFAVGLVESVYFQTYFLPLCEFLILVVSLTLSKVTTTGWAPAIIVFNVSVDKGYRRGFKTISRRFFKTLLVNFLSYLAFFLFTYIAGVYSMVVTIPLVTALLCTFDMITFFTCQGMRYYINSKTIMTPKKLEEVDSIKKAKYII